MPKSVIARLVVLLACAAVAPEAQPRWTVDAKPTFDITGANDAGGVLFGSVSWATRLKNGTIVVADASGPAVHFIGANGKLIKSSGRRGEGPGDFRTVTWVSPCGSDGVYAWDFAKTQITTYDEVGAMKKSFPFGTRGGANTSGSCNQRGMLFAFASPHRMPAKTPPDPNATYAIVGAAASPVVMSTAGDTIMRLPEVPYGEMLSGMVQGRAGGLPRPLGSTTTFALGEQNLFIGITDSAAVFVYSLDGKRVGTIPVSGAGKAPSAQQYATAAEIPLSIVPAQMRDDYRKFVLGVPPPSRLSPFSQLFVDAAGLLWVQTSSPGEAETRFRIFTTSGTPIAQATVPASITIFEIGTDYLLGTRPDADDEPHLIVYRLKRSEGRP